MVQEAMKAAQQMEEERLSVEVIDLRTVKPLDQDLILESVRKTGRLVIADGGWKTCGLSAEISALVAEKGFEFLKAPVRRITLPDCPAPASRTLEAAYYPSHETICSVLRELLLKN
jgi:pyruvate dehydrogenase E1 component beta subunit